MTCDTKKSTDRDENKYSFFIFLTLIKNNGTPSKNLLRPIRFNLEINFVAEIKTFLAKNFTKEKFDDRQIFFYCKKWYKTFEVSTK
jgi:hypothetical protein